jgi:hypothetical protein
MKINILFVAAAAAASIAYYFVSRKKQSKMNGHSQGMKTHHMTDVFARTKEQAVK